MTKNLTLPSFNPSSLDVNHTLNFYLQLRFVNRILLKRKVGESLDWGDCITAGEDKEPGGFEGQPEEVRRPRGCALLAPREPGGGGDGQVVGRSCLDLRTFLSIVL